PSLLRRAPTSPLLPYTTLFRSGAAAQTDRLAVAARDRDAARRWSLLLFELLALRTLRLARAGGLAAATEGTLGAAATTAAAGTRSEEHTSELQSRFDIVCRLLL